MAQYAHVFPLKPAPLFKLFAGFGSTNKSATSLFLSDSRFVLATLSSPLSFLLHHLLWQVWQELSFLSCIVRLQWVFRLSFLPGNDAADELATGSVTCALCHLVSSSLISHIYSSFFSDWKRTVSSKFFDTQVFSISTEKLMLPCHARCVPNCWKITFEKTQLHFLAFG